MDTIFKPPSYAHLWARAGEEWRPPLVTCELTDLETRHLRSYGYAAP